MKMQAYIRDQYGDMQDFFLINPTLIPRIGEHVISACKYKCVVVDVVYDFGGKEISVYVERK